MIYAALRYLTLLVSVFMIVSCDDLDAPNVQPTLQRGIQLSQAKSRFARAKPGEFVVLCGPHDLPYALQPAGVAVDSHGRIFFSVSHAVFMLDRDWRLTLYAGHFPYGSKTTDEFRKADRGDFGGDGGPANQAYLNQPKGLAIDNHDNLYIADSENNRVRRVSPSGVITTVAGSGPLGRIRNPSRFGGDGGPAIQARLAHCMGVACDRHGNLYIADTDNNRIRRVDREGIITTLVGNGETRDPNGSLGDGGLAIAASLKAPWSVTPDDQGDLYIADTANHRIRKVDTRGMISTVAVLGQSFRRVEMTRSEHSVLHAVPDRPFYVAVDHMGTLYVSSRSNVFKMDKAAKHRPILNSSSVQGDSADGPMPRVDARLDNAFQITFDRSGDLLVCDFGNARLACIVHASGIPRRL